MFSNKTRLEIYRSSYRHSKKVWVGWWTALGGILASAVALWTAWGRTRILPHAGPWMQVAFGLCCCAGLLTLLHLLTYSGWFSIRFRYVALHAIRILGAVGKWLLTGWRILLIVLTATTALRWAHWFLTAKPPHPFMALLSLESLIRTGLWSALGTLVFWSYQVRKRIVILAFNNLTGDEALKATVEGIAPRLLNELRRLSELYEITDEARPTQTGDYGIVKGSKDQAQGPKLSIEDIGDALQGVVAADSKIKLGASVEIPIGALMSSVGRTVQGPRLTGSLHKESNGLVLIAQISGGRISGNWKIEWSDLDDRALTGQEAVPAMIEQLAYRVFTTVVRIGSPRWRAVRSYSEGLRIYRHQLRSEQDRQVNLRQAEKQFIEALAEDNQFARNYYNLGIVHRDLGEPDSARVCFGKAIDSDPNLAPAYYALALDARVQLEKKSQELKLQHCKPEDAFQYCKQSILLHPENAESWRLLGILYSELSVLPLKNARREKQQEIVASLEIATALAWRSLCRDVGTKHQADAAAKMAVDCLTDLGYFCSAMPAYKKRSIAVFRQELHLEPTNAEAHFQIGFWFERRGDAAKTYRKKAVNSYRRAGESYSRALRIKEQPIGWAYLTRVQAKLFSATQKQKDREACLAAGQKVLDPLSKALQDNPIFLQIAEEAFKQIEFYPVDYCLDLRPFTPEALKKYAQLKNTVRNGKRWLWIRGFNYLQKGREYSWQKRSDLAVKCFISAINCFREDYAKELEAQRLYSLLADAYLTGRQLEQALHVGRLAVELSPNESSVRAALGNIYFEMGDYDNAEREWQFCLALVPNQSKILQSLASTYLQRAFNCFDSETRRLAISKVINLFRRILDVSTIANERGLIHYWLGRFYSESLQRDQAIQHLNTAMMMRWQPVETMIYLGIAYMDASAYREAEETFAAAAAELKSKRKLGKTVSKDTAPDTISMNEALPQIYLSWADSYAQRGVCLQRAENFVKYVSWPISQLPAKDQQILLMYQSYCLGLIHLKKGELKVAIEKLEEANSLGNSDHIYWRLAQAYLERARTETNGQAELIAKARQFIADMERADINGEHKQDKDFLLKEIDSITVPNAKAAAAARS